jgi:hypothetical protein
MDLQSETVLANHLKVTDSYKFGNIHVKKMTITPSTSDTMRTKIVDFMKAKIKEIFGSTPTLAYDGSEFLYSNGTFPFGTLCERYHCPPLERYQSRTSIFLFLALFSFFLYVLNISPDSASHLFSI